MNLRSEIDSLISAALQKATGLEDAPAIVAVSSKPQFGDYQANGVMAAAKKLGANPRELAEKVIEALDLSSLDTEAEVSVAGPGFINILLSRKRLENLLQDALADEDHLGVTPPDVKQTIVVDYSSPNLAKEMHVGHLRSTIIGDALARTLEFIGHNVIRQNHVGDWGTQFGMLIAYLESIDAGTDAHAIDDLEDFYRKAKVQFDSDTDFQNTARQNVVKLQGGDQRVAALWQNFLDQSLEHCERVYQKLGVGLKREHVRGESAYNDDLSQVVEDLQARLPDKFSESQGAQCVFLEQFKGKDKDGEEQTLPLIIQKSDGGYLYATTDLAAMRFRCGTLKADRILYVTDSRQGQHFAMVFAVAREAGFVPDSVALEHVGFGMMLGANRQPFKTRTGGTVKLMDLLKEAQEKAAELVAEKNPDLSDDEKSNIASTVGIGAVKYADLSQNRASDYVFSWEKMLALEGNTAPYMQYAYARIKSIFRKAGSNAAAAGAISIIEPAERTLALKLAQFPDTITTVAADCMPNVLCAYLYDVAGAFMSFYESCPVLKADDASVRASRLGLCDLTARVIKKGLSLLGIDTIEQM